MYTYFRFALISACIVGSVSHAHARADSLKQYEDRAVRAFGRKNLVTLQVNRLFDLHSNAALAGDTHRRPSDLYAFDELVKLEKKTRNQARLGLIAGSILTGVAVAGNVMAVSEYHSNDTWARLGGTVTFMISHLGFAPAGTGLLIWGFRKRGKGNALRSAVSP